MSLQADEGPLPESFRAELNHFIAELRVRRDELHAAEEGCERIPTLRAMAEHEDEAQAIRDRLRKAKWALEECRRTLVESLRVLAVRDKAARPVLEQIQQLSPYSSVRTADVTLRLLGALPRSEDVAKHARSNPTAAALESISTEHPSEQDRQEVARLLEKAIDDPRYNLKQVRMEMGVAEGTFNRLRSAQSVQPGTWRKALRFLQKFYSDNAK